MTYLHTFNKNNTKRQKMCNSPHTLHVKPISYGRSYLLQRLYKFPPLYIRLYKFTFSSIFICLAIIQLMSIVKLVETDLNHNSNDDDQSDARKNICVVLNEELMAEERGVFVRRLPTLEGHCALMENVPKQPICFKLERELDSSQHNKRRRGNVNNAT